MWLRDRLRSGTVPWGANAVLVLAGVALAAFLARTLDPRAADFPLLSELALTATASRATVALSSQVLASAIGMLMAWVLVTINMTARRYSLRVVDLLISTWTTAPLLALFVGSILTALVTQLTIREDRPRPASVVTVVGLSALCLLLVLPYLWHLLQMLRPETLVGRLRSRARAALSSAAVRAADRGLQRRVVGVAEQASDIALAAINAADLEVAESTLWLLRDLLVDYQQVKARLGPAWFVPPVGDFPGRPVEDLRDMERRRIWLETFVGLEFKLCYTNALNRFPEIPGLVGLALSDAGEAARAAGDPAAVGLFVRLFNSLIRAGINRRDLAAVYNVLNHYRFLGERLLLSDPEAARGVARHLAYYAGEALTLGLDRLWVTAVYDLRRLCREAVASGLEPGELGALLAGEIARAVARRPDLAVEGAKAALLFLADGATAPEAALDPVRDFVRSQARATLAAAAGQVLSLESPAFWELTERGINFDWAAPEARERVRVEVERASPAAD